MAVDQGNAGTDINDAPVVTSARRWRLGVHVVSFGALVATGILVLVNQFGAALATLSAFVWTLGHSLMLVLHRRYLAVRGKLPDAIISPRAEPTAWFLLSNPSAPRRLDAVMYASLLVVGFVSTILWWPSVVALPLVYVLSLLLDRHILTAGTVKPVEFTRDRRWTLLATCHPLANTPILIASFVSAGSSVLVLLATVFWITQAAILVLLVEQHRAAA